MRYVPVAGTGGYADTWIEPGSEFGRMMTAAGCQSILTGERAFRWDGALDGIDAHNYTWQSYADALYYFSRELPYEDRNYILHSHAGQIGILLAASGFPIRSMTTVGTPIRPELPLEKAENYIGFHQHIMDDRFDLWGFLGSWRLGRFDLLRKRAMPDPRVRNIAVTGISHSKILTDREHIRKWVTEGWLASMIAPPVSSGVATV